jgi:EmrB/QacA subfamily drug resistance transporter
MAFIDGTVVNVALPAIQTAFNANVIAAQWVVESYGLFLGALILVGGSLGDHFGRRLIFVLGVVIFALASVGCGCATSIRFLIFSRCVQGGGAALMVPGSLAIISASFEQKTRGRAIGTWSGFTAITSAIGPVLGGWFVEHLSRRWVFFINVPLAIAVIGISLWRVPESRSERGRRIDWIGAAVVTLGLGGVIVGLLESQELGWRHPLVVASLLVGIGCLALFLFLERRSSHPMIPLDMFSSKTFSGANLLTLVLYAAISGSFFLLPMNLIQVQGYSATAAGSALLPLILLMSVLSRWSGGLVARFGPKPPLVLGPLIVAAGFVLFALPSTGASYWRSFFPAAIVLGFGMAITVAPLTTVVMNSAGQERAGIASGINNAVARVAGVLAIAVLGIVMLASFTIRLDREFRKLSLNPEIINEMKSHANRLGGLKVPESAGPAAAGEMKRQVAYAFVFGFRVVMIISACLSLTASAIASLMISKT